VALSEREIETDSAPIKYSRWHPEGLAFDLLTGFAFVCAAGITSEWMIRRRGKSQ